MLRLGSYCTARSAAIGSVHDISVSYIPSKVNNFTELTVPLSQVQSVTLQNLSRDVLEETV